MRRARKKAPDRRNTDGGTRRQTLHSAGQERTVNMWKKLIPCILLGLGILLCAFAQAETNPVSEAELNAFAEKILALAGSSELLNDPAAEEAFSEDGYAYQYEFGVVYGGTSSWTDETRANAFVVMDEEVEGPRGIRIDWEVNRLMDAVPCENTEM